MYVFDRDFYSYDINVIVNYVFVSLFNFVLLIGGSILDDLNKGRYNFFAYMILF